MQFFSIETPTKLFEEHKFILAVTYFFAEIVNKASFIFWGKY